MDSNLLLIVVLLLVLLLVALQLYSLWKLRRIDANTWDSMAPHIARARDTVLRGQDNLFRQWESLLALYTDLHLEYGLPGTRGWAGSPDFLLAVARRVLTTRPARVVECSSGVSTLLIARALQLNGAGHVYSLEHEVAYAEKTRQELDRHGLGDWATVIHAPLGACRTEVGEQRWYDISALPEGDINLLVIDGPPGTTGPLARYPAGPQLFARLSSGAAVYLDDADRPDERDAVARWQREFAGLQSEMVALEKGMTVLRKRA